MAIMISPCMAELCAEYSNAFLEKFKNRPTYTCQELLYVVGTKIAKNTIKTVGQSLIEASQYLDLLGYVEIYRTLVYGFRFALVLFKMRGHILVSAYADGVTHILTEHKQWRV